MGSGGNLITMDKIYVKDLEVMGTIGIFDWEKKIKQKIKFYWTINFNNFSLYNIEGRKYPNGDPVPNNLPKAYGLPRPTPKVLTQNQKCSNCYFNNGGLCSYWNANIRSEYWCAAWGQLGSE